MPFKICNIGCGGISRNCHGPSYVKYKNENPDTELAACCDLDGDRAAAYAGKFGFARHYTDYFQMLDAEKPDAVCVTVDENYTFRVGINVLNMRYPMFIEKPPGKNSAENRQMAIAAKRNDVINQVGYNRRYLPILQKLKSMLPGAGGGIQFIRYDFYRVGRFDEDFSDTAVHGIDAVRYIAGADYKTVRGELFTMAMY